MSDISNGGPGINAVGRALDARRKVIKPRLSVRVLAQRANLMEDTVFKVFKDSAARPLYVVERVAAALGMVVIVVDKDDLPAVAEAVRLSRVARQANGTPGPRLSVVGSAPAGQDK